MDILKDFQVEELLKYPIENADTTPKKKTEKNSMSIIQVKVCKNLYVSEQSVKNHWNKLKNSMLTIWE